MRVSSVFSAIVASLLPFKSFSAFLASAFAALSAFAASFFMSLSALAISFFASLLTFDASFSIALSALFRSSFTAVSTLASVVICFGVARPAPLSIRFKIVAACALVTGCLGLKLSVAPDATMPRCAMY